MSITVSLAIYYYDDVIFHTIFVRFFMRFCAPKITSFLSRVYKNCNFSDAYYLANVANIRAFYECGLGHRIVIRELISASEAGATSTAFLYTHTYTIR